MEKGPEDLVPILYCQSNKGHIGQTGGISLPRAEAITFQILSALQTILGEGMVHFNTLTIRLKDVSHPDYYGYTTSPHSNPEITVFVKDQMGEFHFCSTLLHEIGHALTNEKGNGGHTANWYLLTAKLMAITEQLCELDIRDKNGFYMCSMECGMNSFKLCGLTAAPFTPMSDKGEVDYTRIEEYSKYLASNGIKQIFVNGTTGEGMNLTLDERKKVVEKWMEFGRKTGRQTAMVVHCGALNVDDACDLARHAVKVGADAISTIPPTYFKPNSIEMAIRFCEQVASAAPSLPFYYYHIPGMTGVNVNIEDFLKKSQDRIPTLAGIKFSCCDIVDLCGALNVKTKNRADGRFNIIFGTDEALVAGMSTGADGGVGSTYNFMPGIIHRLMNHIENGNMVEARKEQHRVQQACRVMYKYGTLLGHNVASLKAFMTVVGFDLGPVRSPIRSMTADEIAQYKKDLEEIGFFDWYK